MRLRKRPRVKSPPEPFVHPAAVPVTLLTGFLGSGKTTLLNALLDRPELRDTAVIVNEFGSVAVDHDLIRHGTEQYLLTSTGCLCCTAGSDIQTSLAELRRAVAAGLAPAFSRVIVETTGLADPAPIIASLLAISRYSVVSDFGLEAPLALAGVVTTFDAVLGPDTLDQHFECWKQLAFADQVVLTKTDTAGALPFTNLQATIRTLNPTARVFDRHRADFGILGLLPARSYSPSDKSEDVQGWLALAENDASSHTDHDHDPNRHGARIRSFTLVHDGPLDADVLDSFMHLLALNLGSSLLRLKGFLAFRDDPDRPFLVQAVQNIFYPLRRLDQWPSEDRRSRLVLIGTDLPEPEIRKLFTALFVQSPKRSRRKARQP